MAEQILRIKDNLGNTHDLAIELDSAAGVYALRTKSADPTPAGQNFIGFTNPSRAKDFVDGKFRGAGAKVSISGSGTGYMQLQNPTGSGINIMVTEFVLSTSLNAEINFWTDSVLTSPTTHSIYFPNRAYEGSGLTTAAIVRTSTAVTTAGTRLSPVYRMAANAMIERDFTMVLAPGQNITISAQTAALEAMDLYGSATWVEPA